MFIRFHGPRHRLVQSLPPELSAKSHW
jgi:hypothetical protein